MHFLSTDPGNKKKKCQALCFLCPFHLLAFIRELLLPHTGMLQKCLQVRVFAAGVESAQFSLVE